MPAILDDTRAPIRTSSPGTGALEMPAACADWPVFASQASATLARGRHMRRIFCLIGGGRWARAPERVEGSRDAGCRKRGPGRLAFAVDNVILRRQQRKVVPLDGNRHPGTGAFDSFPDRVPDIFPADVYRLMQAALGAAFIAFSQSKPIVQGLAVNHAPVP